MNIEMKKCDICGNPIDIHYMEDGTPYWTEGHNAQPIVDGRCCDKCQNEVVLPERLAQILALREWADGIEDDEYERRRYEDE